LQPQDALFVPGEALPQAYCLRSGALSYYQDPECALVDVSTSVPVAAGTWFCEAALWSHWIHVGTAEATAQCKLIVVKAELMTDILKMPMRNVIRSMTQQYGQKFYSKIIEPRAPDAAMPSDLAVPYTAFEELFASMDSPVQMLLGQLGIKRLKDRIWVRLNGAKVVERLQKQVEEGDIVAMPDMHNEFLRVAVVTSVRLIKPSGHIFTQIGERDATGVVVMCRLPAVKQVRGETPLEAVERLLERKLQNFSFEVSIMSKERQDQCMYSKEYGVRTKYLRTVFDLGVLEFSPQECEWANQVEGKTSFKTSKHVSKISGREVMADRSDRSVSWFMATFPDELATATKRTSNAEISASNLCERDVHYLIDGNRSRFYAWLQPNEFDFLCQYSAASDSILKTWLSRVNVPFSI